MRWLMVESLGSPWDGSDPSLTSSPNAFSVLIQRPEWGGGEVWFDGELIRKDGLFVPKDLKPLNPANLK